MYLILFIIFNILCISTQDDYDKNKNFTLGMLIAEDIKNIRKEMAKNNISEEHVDNLENNIKSLLEFYHQDMNRISLNKLTIFIIFSSIISLWTYILVNIQFFIKYFKQTNSIQKENKQPIKKIIY